ncbi:P-loop containing nucleoside triphosphate hydrolase protein [Trichodelitschia bisporula]|uniref:DNA 3'-5' helicase n=1 Tax=Trichodelitschia bisporula TaxID=703511 RepID=A0A6G1I3N1_9PEZI|nr:P-loop containing nucleoside triphosphate hydrolase protein [Trichodelitschia bisporula]
MEPAKARARISKLKSGTAAPTEAKAKGPSVDQQEFVAIFTEYEEALETSNLLDYDDLLLRCVELLKRFPECVSNIQAVLIDEFQDTNHVQYELMSLFAQHRDPKTPDHKIPSITIVGDPDQSIYSFRSAEIKNLRKMTTQYPGTHVVILEENYRSSGSILQSALEVIEQDESRPEKKLLPTHCIGERPVLRTLSTPHKEADWLVGEIRRCEALNAGLLKYSDFAVLLRSASLSRHIESALGKAGIPYRMVGGHKFFDRVEVKLVLDYLRVIGHPEHNDALARIINVPPRKIGETAMKTLFDEADRKKIPLWTHLLDVCQGRSSSKISAQAERSLSTLIKIILTSRTKLAEADETGFTIPDLMEYFMERLSLKKYLEDKYQKEGRWANVEELLTLARDASASLEAEAEADALAPIDGVNQDQPSGLQDLLTRFLANVALSTEAQDTKGGTETPNQVTLSTIHAAKGLEWPVVFIPGAFQGSIPHSRAEDTDEERRLLYVGMTRAKALLYLSRPKKNSNREDTTLSPFLSAPNMSRFFAPRGPSFTLSTLRDLSRILHRPCPAPSAFHAVIEAAIRDADFHVEDDRFPEDPDERPQEDTSYVDYDKETPYPPGKRARLSHAPPTTSATGFRSASSTIFSAGTYSNTALGFTSARTAMAELEAAAQTAEPPPEPRDKARTTGKKRQISGQGTLGEFFKPKSTAAKPAATNPVSNPATLPPKAARMPNLPARIPNAALASILQPTGIPPSLAQRQPRKTPMRTPSWAAKPLPPADENAAPPPEPDGEAEPLVATSFHTTTFQAATLHTTTMVQLTGTGVGVGRRALGLRSSGAGAGGGALNRPFKPPGRAG